LKFGVSGTTEKYSTVYAIEPAVEVATRTLQVRAIAENRDGKLLPGTFANVELPLDDQRRNRCSDTSSDTVQNGKKFFISNLQNQRNHGQKQLQELTPHFNFGLKAGDTVITSGVMSLKMTPVKVSIK
jgi:membrane fusion protein (multidrug efflux system)